MIKISKNVLLSKHSNYRIGGKAKYFFEAKTVKEIKDAILWAKANKQKVFILGGGTNLLFSDKGYNGLVLKVSINHLKAKGERIFVGAGVSIEDLLKFSAQKKLSGLEWAGGLPGALGGAIRGNAGAFKGETKDNIESVESFNIKTLEVEICKNKACQFSYRTSFFKKKDGEFIITAATIKLKKGNTKQIQALIDDKIKFRKAKHPLEFPNSGSVFKNTPLSQVLKEKTLEYKEGVRQASFNLRGTTVPVKNDPFPVIPTAFLISAAGLKGTKSGGAMISTKHPNFIINVSGAKATDILALIKLIKVTLKRKFGLKVEEEVQIVGY
ncbi:MAG: UDP-N-acetylmuramate dehydrogenase [Patescibacteria group bacterium]